MKLSDFAEVQRLVKLRERIMCMTCGKVTYWLNNSVHTEGTLTAIQNIECRLTQLGVETRK